MYHSSSDSPFTWGGPSVLDLDWLPPKRLCGLYADWGPLVGKGLPMRVVNQAFSGSDCEFRRNFHQKCPARNRMTTRAGVPVTTGSRYNPSLPLCATTVVCNDHRLVKRRPPPPFFAVNHCATTTRWSNGETVLVVAKKEEGCLRLKFSGPQKATLALCVCPGGGRLRGS